MRNAAVVGLGNIGIGYDLKDWGGGSILSHSKAYLRHKGFDLKCGIDISAERRSIFQKYTGKPAHKEIASLAMYDIDIVSICVPTDRHLPAIKDVLESVNPECIICEKPLAYNERDCHKILELCGRRGVKLAVNYMRRWDESSLKIKEMICRGQLGNIQAVNVYYTKGLFNNASHAIDLLHYWFGREKGAAVIRHKKSSAKEDIDTSFILSYTGFNAVFQCVDEKDYSIFEIDILGQKGRVEYNSFGEDIRVYKVIKDPFFKNYRRLGGKARYIGNGMKRYQYNVVSGIDNSLRLNRKIVSDGDTAAKTLETCAEVKRLCRG